MQYCIDEKAEEPIMLIDSYIGHDATEEANGNFGILGDVFVKELLFLDTLGKNKIQIWINSIGGVVMDGMAIYNAILKTKTKVDTYCMGIAASISAVIFQAGRNRCMADNATLMYHDPYSEDGKKDDQLEMMRQSIALMISTRTGKTKEEILSIMNATTWINAQNCFKDGFCDEVENSGEINKPRVNKEKADIQNAFLEGKKVLTKILNKEKLQIEIPMKTVANKLGLNPEASESAILSEVERLQNKSSDADKKAKKMEEEMDKLKKDLEDKKAEYDKFKKEAEDKAKKDKEEADKKAEAEAEDKAKSAIQDYVKKGKIVNKKEVIEVWEKKATEDLAGVKIVLDAMPSTNRAINLQEEAAKNKGEENQVDGLPTNAAYNMAQLKAKLKK